MGMLYHRKYKRADGTVGHTNTWWCKIYVNGQAVRLNTHATTERHARDFMASKEVDGKRGLPVLPKVNRKTVGELLDDVLEDYRNQGHDSLTDAEGRVRNHLRPVFGNWNAAGVTDAEVRKYVADRKAAGAANATVNRELALLRRGYTLNERTVTVRPKIEMLKENNARKGFFERAQYETVRAALPCELRELLTVAYVTGWRIQSELLPLTWKQVDFTARTLRLEPGTTKNDEGREFPFTQALELALRAQRDYTDQVQRAEGIVCPSVFHRNGHPIRTWRRSWLTALRAAGLATVTGKGKTRTIRAAVVKHDFRRTAIRNLARAGVSEAVAMKMCGHETRSVFDRYNITTGDDLRAAAAKLDAVTSVTGTVSGTVTQIFAGDR